MRSFITLFHSNNRIKYVVFILILLLCGIKWAWHLQDSMDITFGDEAQYLRYGTDLFHTIKKDWGPSYNLWYKFLSFFRSDYISLFYLNYQVTAILAGLLLLIFLVRYGVSWTISVWMSFCFMLSSTVIDTWPRVSHFSIILLLTFLIFIKNVSSVAKKMILLCIAFYFAAYARPELFSSFVLISVVTIYFLFRERADYKQWLPLLAVAVIIIGVYFSIYQFPADSYKGINRTYIAFSQHYAINYVMEHQSNFNPISEWIPFAKKTFGSCADFGCILKTHTDLVIHNTIINIKKYFLTLLQFIVSVLFPVKIIGKKIILQGVLLFFVACTLAVAIYAPYRKQFIAYLRQHALLILILFLFGLPSMGASVLIFPRQHYLLMHAILIIFLIGLMLSSINIFKIVQPIFLLLIFIPILIKSPTAKKYTYYQGDVDSKNKCNRHLVEFLSKNNNKQPHTVFSNHLSLSMLLPNNYADFNTEYEFKPGMSFRQLADEKHIDYVLVRNILLQDKQLNADTTWTDFIQKPDTYGFKKVSYCDSCESYLLIKE